MSSEYFINYYDILQVSPDCDIKILEAAYRHLAKMYHPDHVETADVTKFNEVIEAYRILRNPTQRAEYDLQHAANVRDRSFGDEKKHQSTVEIDSGHNDISALDDANIHAKILMLLYKKRRESAREVGFGGFYLQEILQCSDENFEFHVWYLKAKGFIELTEQGTWAITIQGVDHVIATSQTTEKEKLRITQMGNPES